MVSPILLRLEAQWFDAEPSAVNVKAYQTRRNRQNACCAGVMPWFTTKQLALLSNLGGLQCLRLNLPIDGRSNWTWLGQLQHLTCLHLNIFGMPIECVSGFVCRDS